MQAIPENAGAQHFNSLLGDNGPNLSLNSPTESGKWSRWRGAGGGLEAMNTTRSETNRLADAVVGLAGTIAEIIEARLLMTRSALEENVEAKGNALEQRSAQKTLQPIYNKRQAAVYFHVSVRTVDNWMRRGLLPYLKIGRTVRIPMH